MAHLYYIHDPMCSWCWGFRPVMGALLRRLPEGIGFSRWLVAIDYRSADAMLETLRLLRS